MCLQTNPNLCRFQAEICNPGPGSDSSQCNCQHTITRGLRAVFRKFLPVFSFVLTAFVIPREISAGTHTAGNDASHGAAAIGTRMRDLVEADWLNRDAGFGLEKTERILRKAKTLARRLQPVAESRRLQLLTDRLRRLETRLKALPVSEKVPEHQKRAIHLESRWLARDIAFCNPRLLEIRKLLFITRHDAVGVFHMVDQFYGFNAQPGGQLLVLDNPFGPDPKLVNLLDNSPVEAGRLKGHMLAGGAFLSPEVSFDGETVLFAYSEAEGKDLEWSHRASYHLFRVNADGTGLAQLTDGTWNDFDPCFLPNGRVAFISERRGGFLRCGRYCPTYTMFSMESDGSDIVCLSFHETHEWHPSIAHDGHIVYTRWDYVDRDTNIAHHPWTCRPDGGDPRVIHGNYPARRESRPWMEMDIRAIPGSHKLVAVAAAHHGHAFGSLVVIDPRVEDNNAMSPLTRLTPEVPFPEAEKHIQPIEDTMVYGTPWPLSEDDYLCVYDPASKNRGIYWIDRFGNKELIYRDPSISSLSPIPLQPRPQPPVIPDQTLQTAAELRHASESSLQSTIAVMNVYDSRVEWPAGTKINALRIVQVLPKTTPAPNQPRIGVADQTNARAALGTVPVESDGSAYFEVPPGRQYYFQVLDEQGLAVQSMRSGTYVHPGERLTCQGCHEPRLRTPRHTGRMPLALKREPSQIQPEPDGSSPFNYVRLVQPVLDRNCVECHRENQALDLTGSIEGKNGWTRSYRNLAPEYGFYFHVNNGSINSGVHGGSRTIPGKFGARASKLLPYLDSEHHGVRLSTEDHRRLTLWLDCNSEFFGSYENTEAQARGEVVLPTLH